MQSKNYNIVLIRHAQSIFNQATFQQANNLKITHYSWNQLIQNQQFNKRVSYGKLLMDAPLSKQGLSQCQYYKKQCASIHPNLILVSPYRRALETCKLLFPSNQQTKIIVQPLIAQVFRYTCDITIQLQENRKKYSNFDFTKLQHLGNDWYLSNLNQSIQQKIKYAIKTNNIQSHTDKQNLLLSMLENKQITQSSTMLRKRASAIKKLLKNYQKQYPIIVLISHYYLIESLMAKSFDSQNNAQQLFPRNCHPYYRQLSQLLKVQ